MSRVVLLYGHQALVDEYNTRVAEKLSVIDGKSTKSVGFNRGIRQMMLDIETFHPWNSYLAINITTGGVFDSKKQFYRLISLLLSDLGLIFDIRSPSPWQIISQLQKRGIIGESVKVKIKECLSIANEIRLKTYLANNGQKELFSPLPQNSNAMEESADVPIFRDFDEDILVQLLSTSFEICGDCLQMYTKYIKQGDIDFSVLQNLSPAYSTNKKKLLGILYYRLENYDKALEYLKSISEESPNYREALFIQGCIYKATEQYKKSVDYFEKALWYDDNEEISKLALLRYVLALGGALLHTGDNKIAVTRFEEAISIHSDIYGEGSETIYLSCLYLNLGCAYRLLYNHRLAVKSLRKMEQVLKGLKNVGKSQICYLNFNMAQSLSSLGYYEESLKYLERGLQLCKEVFGQHTFSTSLTQMYAIAAEVYDSCKQDDKAESFFKLSLDMYGDKRKPGKIIT